jgi:hypothetical protein
MSSWSPRLCAVALLAALAPAAARAQDTTRVRAEPVRADSSRPRQDTTRVDTARLQVRIPVPPPAPAPWRFQLDLGFQDAEGNRNLTVFNGLYTMERRSADNFILGSKLDVRYGKSNGVEAVNSQALSLRFDWHPRSPISPFFGVDVQRDPIRKIALRAQGGTGFNFNTDIRDDRRTYFSLGLVFDHQDHSEGVSPASVDDTRWMLRASRTRLYGPATRVEFTAKLQPATRDLQDYLASAVAAVRVGLTRRTGLTTRLEYTRNSRPAPGIVPDDRSLSVALSFGW